MIGFLDNLLQRYNGEKNKRTWGQGNGLTIKSSLKNPQTGYHINQIKRMNLPILLYHHVVKESNNSDLAPFIVNETDFIWQLDLLEELGYSPIILKDLLTKPNFDRKVIITFDDCPKNLLDCALPHLEKKKWKAVFFAPYSHLGGYNEWNVRKGKSEMPLMTTDEVKHVSDLGHEIGAHSMTHPHLNKCTPSEIEYEINESKKQLDALLGNPVVSFAYPYGHYPTSYREILSKADYKYAVSMYSKSFTTLSDPYCIRRTVVEQGDTAITFKRKISPMYNYLRVFSDYFILRKTFQ